MSRGIHSAEVQKLTSSMECWTRSFKYALITNSFLKHRLIGKRDDKPFPLQTMLLTFGVPTLLSSILVGYESEFVHQYISNPMWYPNMPHCANCSAGQASSDRSCLCIWTNRLFRNLWS
jgi:hypothetical protein